MAWGQERVSKEKFVENKAVVYGLEKSRLESTVFLFR